MLKNFSSRSSDLELPTAIKIMSFGVRRNLHYPKLTDAVVRRILDDPSALSLRDIVSLLNFVTRVKVKKGCLLVK